MVQDFRVRVEHAFQACLTTIHTNPIGREVM